MREALFIKFFICIAPFLIKLAWLFILNSNLEEELGSRLGGLRFGVDAEGNYGYIKEGEDTVIPFISNSQNLEVEIYTGNFIAQKDYDYIILVLAANTYGNFSTWISNALSGHGGEEVASANKFIDNTGYIGYRVVKNIKKGTSLSFHQVGYLFCIGK